MMSSPFLLLIAVPDRKPLFHFLSRLLKAVRNVVGEAVVGGGVARIKHLP
jgi:hypothetical protein